MLYEALTSHCLTPKEVNGEDTTMSCHEEELICIGDDNRRLRNRYAGAVKRRVVLNAMAGTR